MDFRVQFGETTWTLGIDNTYGPNHDDATKWKHFPLYWPFVRGIHRSPVNFLHKGQWRGALMFSLIWAWTNVWVNNRDAGDLRRHHAYYDISVMNDVVQHGHEISRNLAPLRMPLRATVLLMLFPPHNSWLLGYRFVITRSFIPFMGLYIFTSSFLWRLWVHCISCYHHHQIGNVTHSPLYITCLFRHFWQSIKKTVHQVWYKEYSD